MLEARRVAVVGASALVARLAPAGAELSIGMIHDPLLGPMLVIGAGGVAGEVVGDRRVALPPSMPRPPGRCTPEGVLALDVLVAP